MINHDFHFLVHFLSSCHQITSHHPNYSIQNYDCDIGWGKSWYHTQRSSSDRRESISASIIKCSITISLFKIQLTTCCGNYEESWRSQRRNSERSDRHTYWVLQSFPTTGRYRATCYIRSRFNRWCFTCSITAMCYPPRSSQAKSRKIAAEGTL